MSLSFPLGSSKMVSSAGYPVSKDLQPNRPTKCYLHFVLPKYFSRWILLSWHEVPHWTMNTMVTGLTRPRAEVCLNITSRDAHYQVKCVSICINSMQCIISGQCHSLSSPDRNRKWPVTFLLILWVPPYGFFILPVCFFKGRQEAGRSRVTPALF